MKNPINESGLKLEESLENYLRVNGLPYKRNSNGIDFIVGDGQYYIECKNQTQGGSVNEKLPHTIWKYQQKYGMDTMYIIQPYTDGMGVVMNHIQWLESMLGINVHIVSYEDMCNVLSGNKIDPPSIYW